MVQKSPERPDWPALLSTEQSAHYLSMDENSFLFLVETYGVPPLDLPLQLARWRRADLDRLLRRIPSKPMPATKSVLLDEKAIERAVERAVAREMAAARPRGQTASAEVVRESYGIGEAAAMLGMGRSTLYNLISDGKLTVTHVGRRTLIRRAEILRLLGDGN